jgi:hypothetical protein
MPFQRSGPPPPSAAPADLKARVARSWDRAGPASDSDPLPPILLDVRAPHPRGWAVWRVGSLAGPAVAAPDLAPDRMPDPRVARRYFERILATARGACHRCGAAASVDLDPTSQPAAWSVLEVGVTLVHAHGCPCEFTEADRVHLDQRAFDRG